MTLELVADFAYWPCAFDFYDWTNNLENCASKDSFATTQSTMPMLLTCLRSLMTLVQTSQLCSGDLPLDPWPRHRNWRRQNLPAGLVSSGVSTGWVQCFFFLAKLLPLQRRWEKTNMYCCVQSCPTYLAAIGIALGHATCKETLKFSLHNKSLLTLRYRDGPGVLSHR